MNISQRLRTCARHTGLDAMIELLNEAADEIDRLSGGQQAEAKTDEPVAWLDEMLADTKEVFDANGTETPQVVRDVIEYVASWITVYNEKRHPAPGVPEKLTVDPSGVSGTADEGYVAGWNACRAAITQADAKTDEPVAWLYIEDGEVMFGHPNGYRPPDARPLVFGDTRPAPGVPEFSRIAKRKLDELQEQGFAITGYAIQRGTERGFITDGGFVGWWRSDEAPGVQGVPDGYVLVPLQVLHDASDALGNFIMDHGWGDSDMQAMDNLDAYIAQHTAAQAQKGGE